jgi:hypothetical protein
MAGQIDHIKPEAPARAPPQYMAKTLNECQKIPCSIFLSSCERSLVEREIF